MNKVPSVYIYIYIYIYIKNIEWEEICGGEDTRSICLTHATHTQARCTLKSRGAYTVFVPSLRDSTMIGMHRFECATRLGVGDVAVVGPTPSSAEARPASPTTLLLARGSSLMCVCACVRFGVVAVGFAGVWLLVVVSVLIMFPSAEGLGVCVCVPAGCGIRSAACVGARPRHAHASHNRGSRQKKRRKVCFAMALVQHTLSAVPGMLYRYIHI